MNKIDRRKHYLLMIDTETANTHTDEDGRLDTTNCLCYDIGGAVIDTHGEIYETFSFVNKDIFFYEPILMESAYYATKIPLYYKGLADGTKKMADTKEIRFHILNLLEKYGITECVAHNARFDCNALNTTERYTTKSEYRYFLPYGIEWLDSLKMARDILRERQAYKDFCAEHNFLTARGLPRYTAEVLYAYITDTPEFQEEHTGLADVLIEAKIVEFCYKQHKKMRKKLYENS